MISPTVASAPESPRCPRIHSAAALLFLLCVAGCSGSSVQLGGPSPEEGKGAGGAKGDISLDDPPSGDDPKVILEDQDPPDTCGDGTLDETEACDDGNTESGDGCYENCLIVESGFVCPKPDEACRAYAKCGDGRINFPEQCDDGNTTDLDGCSSYCKLEIGSECRGEPSECSDTECGNHAVEGAEGCDDGNAIPFDGCDARCQWEPTCGAPGTSEGCSSFCGDGILWGDEECDDGNTQKGDGCSETCKEEDGYSCSTASCDQESELCTLSVPAVYRDFVADHLDFEVGCGGFEETTNVVESSLDQEGKPVLLGETGPCIQSPESFARWYRTSDESSTIVSELVLFSNRRGGYVNRFGSDGSQYENQEGDLLDGTPLFFPLDDVADCEDGETFGCALPDTRVTAELPGEDTYEANWTPEPNGALHNFSFTSHVSYWFEYDEQAPATLDFLGDDDFWVFVNGRLVVDLGGPHTPLEASITLDAATSADHELGLEHGRVYPISVFHAERRAKGSSFRLTLSGFFTERSLCVPECGDGVVAGNEECDDGENDGGHNECQPGCVLAGYCGDGIVQEEEECDDRDPDAPGNCSGCRLLTIR